MNIDDCIQEQCQRAEIAFEIWMTLAEACCLNVGKQVQADVSFKLVRAVSDQVRVVVQRTVERVVVNHLKKGF